MFLRQAHELVDDPLKLLIAYEFEAIKWFVASLVVLVWASFLVVGCLKPALSPRGVRGLDVVVACIVGYGLLSTIWSPDIKAAVLQGIFGVIVLSFYVLARITAERDIDKILMSFVIVSLAGNLGLFVAAGDPVLELGFGNENFAAEFVTLATGLSFALWCRAPIGRWALFLAASIGLGFLVAFSTANLQFLGLAAGIAFVFLAMLVHWRRFSWQLKGIFASGVSVAIVVSALFAASTISIDAMPQNARDRLQIWATTALMFEDRPAFGSGIGGFYYVGSDYVDRYQEVFPELGDPAYDNLTRQPNAAENELFQAAAEYGGFGLLLVLALFVIGLGTALRAPRWPDRLLGLPVAIVAGLALVSFPLQHAATVAPVAVLLGLLAQRTWVGAEGGQAARLRVLCAAVLVFVVGLPLAYLTLREVRAELVFSEGAAFHGDLRYGEAAARMTRAQEISDLKPSRRLRAYTQTMVAGPDYWREHQVTRDVLDMLYQSASSAAPGNPLLLDLRLKQLLSESGRSVDVDEIEQMLALLLRATGRQHANGHILEAALAIQLGDPKRARRALRRAKRLIGDPPSETDETHIMNINTLERSLLQ